MINEDDRHIARTAADGDATAQKQVTSMVHPLISRQSEKFCKRYCRENRYQVKCSLVYKPFPPPSSLSPLCEWGNATYAWMLEYLTSTKRLIAYEGRNGASLENYLRSIIFTLPFYERWKNWRFERRINVPTCVQKISPHAAKIFYGLYNQKAMADITVKGLTEEEVAELADQIVITLTKNNRLHVLNPVSEVSLTGFGMGSDEDENGEHQGHIAWIDVDFAQLEISEKLQQAWQKLDPIEQFVLEAMLIEKQKAEDVLFALKERQVSIKKGILPNETTVQQLYYFFRKILSKLAKLFGIDKSER